MTCAHSYKLSGRICMTLELQMMMKPFGNYCEGFRSSYLTSQYRALHRRHCLKNAAFMYYTLRTHNKLRAFGQP